MSLKCANPEEIFGFDGNIFFGQTSEDYRNSLAPQNWPIFSGVLKQFCQN